MKEENKKAIINRYNERLKIYGYDPRALGWFKGRQPIRFKVLSEIGDLNDCSLLDVGCGFGDLYGFMTKKGLNIEYTGVDINPDLIKIAKEIYPVAHFEGKDVGEEELDNFDWVFASGLFEFKVPDDEYVKNMLKRMHEICNKGVTVDFISNYVDFENENAYYASPEEIFSFCKTLSKRVTLRHDYMPFEFCIYIYKDDRRNEKNVFMEFDNDCVQDHNSGNRRRIWKTKT